MSKRKSTNISTILSSFVILLVVVMAVGFLFVKTENFTTSLKTFSVRCGHDDFYSDRENFDIVLGQEYKFYVNTNIDVGTENKYIVSVVPNSITTTAFSYNVDGEVHNFADLKSLAKGFSIVGCDDYFIISANMELIDILQLYHPETTISNVPTAVNSDLPYFRLVIQSADQTETININFNLKSE